jgi:hypothetical protein
MQRTARLDGLGSSNPLHLLSLREPSVDELHRHRAFTDHSAWVSQSGRTGCEDAPVARDGRRHKQRADAESERKCRNRR